MSRLSAVSKASRLTFPGWNLGLSSPPLRLRAVDRPNRSSGQRLEYSVSKTLGRQIRWIGTERPVDREQCEFGTALVQEELCGAGAESAVFGEPCQSEFAEKIDAFGVGFELRQRDMKQWVIGEVSQGVFQPCFG